MEGGDNVEELRGIADLQKLEQCMPAHEFKCFYELMKVM